jgi:hypothetical protein
MRNGGGGRRQAVQRGGPGNEAAGRRIAGLEERLVGNGGERLLSGGGRGRKVS